MTAFSGEPNLSEQQARPLRVEGASVALSAGAGCGKTTVLTARFLGDLEGDAPRPLSEIVALTFTEKAARELRKRIRERCRARVAQGDEPARWRAVLRGLEAAPIGTFHEFCGQWLRRHAVEAGIDPDFVILDESIAGTLRDEALGRSLRQWLAQRDPDLIELAVEFGLRQVREALDDLLAERSAGRLADWESRTPEEIVALWHAAWQQGGRDRLFEKTARAARACLALLAAHECTNAKMRDRAAFLLAHLPGLYCAADDDDQLAAVAEQAKIQGSRKEHWPSPEAYEQVKDSLAGLRDAIKSFRGRARWDEQATLEAAGQGVRLARLALRARKAYDAAKRLRGGLDFDDLLIRTRDLLAAEVPPEPELIERLLVDEFQDTDPIQSEILERLAGPGVLDGRLFLVGDFKQSIYRFRGAQPEIFQDFRARFRDAGRHALTENFRSVPAILDFVNALFADTFPEPETALQPRVPGNTAAAGQPAVEFLWASEPDEPANPKGSARDRRRSEARWLARRIRQRLDAGWTVRDRATGQLRAAHAGDVAFLFRAMTDVGPYESALHEEGFDYHTIGGAAFYAQQEIHDLINVLSAIEDPLDAVALAGALRSPFFCLSDDGLFWLGTAQGSLVAGFAGAESIAEINPNDARLAARARALLANWRDLKDHTTIAALVERVLDESGYEAALLGESLGARKRANARKLVRLARRFDQQGGFTLAAFVARLRADLRRPPREEQAATTDEEGTSIRLMSIHQAKGLEFPIVVLPDLNRRAPARSSAVAFHPLLGPLVRPSRDPSADGQAGVDSEDGGETDPDSRQSLGWLVYNALEQYEDDQEALRLFYVATTRARDALVLSAAMRPTDRATSPALRLLDERFDRRTGECRAALPAGMSAPHVHVTLECLPPTAEPALRPGWRLPLIEVAEQIEQADVIGSTTAAPLLAANPRYVDLDPAAGLGPAAARIDRLSRRVLADPGLFVARDWARHAAQVLQRHDGLLPDRCVDAVLARIEPWMTGRLARALADSTAVERSVDWVVAWSHGDPRAIVFRGTTDLLYRGSDGGCRLILWSDAAADAARERLRLLLAARASESSTLGPVRQAWRIRLGPGGGIDSEEDLADRRLDEAVDAFLREA